MDQVTQRRIATLHPSERATMTKIIEEIDSVLTGRAAVRITHALRTRKEQYDLYALGRTVVNPNGKSPTRPFGFRVTDAKAGQSVHNYGFAVDICLIIDGKEASWDIMKDWDGDKVADWDECVKIFAKYGYSWGGSWAKFRDFPHFEKIGRNNWRVLSQMKTDKQGYVIL